MTTNRYNVYEGVTYMDMRPIRTYCTPIIEKSCNWQKGDSFIHVLARSIVLSALKIYSEDLI